MLRSMFAGVSGLRSHQAFMDVVGNNIANVNTTGYKTSNVVFQDLLSQQLKGGGAPIAGTTGGTNPSQVGLGVRLGGVTLNFAQGASQLTGRSTDFSIQGDGLFIVDQGGTRSYTRSGAFSLDGLGQLVTPDGGFIQGWQANAQGVVNTNSTITALKIPVGQTIAPVVSTLIKAGGNLPADTLVGTNVNVSINVFNSLGSPISLRGEFRKIADTPGAVNWELRSYDSANTLIAGPSPVTFNLSGTLTSPNVNVTMAQLNTIPGTAGTWAAGGITYDFGTAATADRLTGSAKLNSVAALSQDGSAIGSLVGFSVSNDGLVAGVFSNGRNQPLGQIGLAVFTNPAGLEKAGGSLYHSSVNSGEPQVGVAGVGGRGSLSGGTLEMSNVDLAAEFTNLIIAQRGFQANSKIITASDEILQDLVNLKR